MSRAAAIERAAELVDSGRYRSQLAELVAVRTESQDPEQTAHLRDYLERAISPRLQALGFTTRIVDNDLSPAHPFLIAHRVEDPALPTVLTYGHGDVQLAHAPQWRDDLDPWVLTEHDGRYYGRGVADNKGQHLINLLALEQVLAERGELGFNLTLLLETGEEVGSPGLDELCQRYADELAADLFLASDGPRIAESTPTVFLGARGVANLRLTLELRDGPHHSGNWGGLLRNPATVLAAAIASMVSADGRILVDALRPELPESVRRALDGVTPGADGPGIDDGWGEPGLTPAERVFAFNALEVLAFGAGDIDGVVNAIPARASAVLQLRFVPGLDGERITAIVRAHLVAHGFDGIEVALEASMAATRLDPDNPWSRWALASLRRTTGTTPTLVPGLGGSLPNAAFALGLGLPTIWVPHSYPGCSQHAPNEHLPVALVREGLQVMTGLLWDLTELGTWPPASGEQIQ